MSIRVTPEMLTGTTLANIDSSLSAMQRTSEELSSGHKVLEPSDDPYGASQIVDLQSQLDGLGSYATSVQEATAWENTASGALTNMSNVVQSARQLLVQATNGTNNQSDLQSIAVQIEQLTEALKQDANTQYAGQYVFSGTATTTAPYTQGAEDAYKGNEGTVSRAVGPGVSVAIGTDISSLLGSGQSAGDGKLLDTLRTIAQHLRGGTAEDLAALGSTDLQSLEGSIDTLSTLQADAGSATDQLQTAASRIEGLQSSIGQALSNVQDSNYAEVSMAYSNEQAAFDAALRAGATIIQESLLQFLQ